VRSKLSHADLAFRTKLAILLLEIVAPFVLYFALQSGYNWLAMVCLAMIVLGLIGVFLIHE
jgi:hypothetical protein